MAADREYDLVVFGATGFTGLQLVKQLRSLNICKRWAVAGRRLERLEALKTDWGATGVIVADVSDPASLSSMAKRCRVLLNATGPYRFLGEPVVRACVEEKADYLDLCGEPEFMEAMLLKYGEQAQQTGVIVCHACAFDSVPADLGILRCAEMFEQAGGECGHVEMFHTIEAPLGYSGHVTTFEAAVHGIGAAKDLGKVRRDLDAKYGRIPKGSTVLGPLPKRSGAYYFERRLGRYALPFPGSDASVVRSSRRMSLNILKQAGVEKRMPQFAIFFTIASTCSLVKVALGGLVMKMLSSCSCGRGLLLGHPGLFTFGFFSEAGPTPEQMANNRWIGEFYASGMVGGSRKDLVLKAELADPGYIGTAMLFGMMAQTVLEDRGRLAAQGGVFTPAALVGEACPALLARLEARGFSFQTTRSDLAA